MSNKNNDRRTEAGNQPASGAEEKPVADVREAVPDVNSGDLPKNDPAASQDTSDERLVIVVCGSKESLPLLTTGWEQKASFARIVPMNVDGKTFPEVVDALLIDDNLPDDFVLVPENCFPTHRVTIADLYAYRVRCIQKRSDTSDLVKVNETRLPMLFRSKVALDATAKLEEEYLEEEFLKEYNALAHVGELPDEIGMTFGNIVSYVVKQPSCSVLVFEAFAKKKFICPTREGFPFIEQQLAKLYGKK